MNKKIPICIVSYNRSLYLRSLLTSLKNELEDFEIIVVDNGSFESSMKLVREEWSSKITWIQLPGNDWINDEYKAKNAFLDYCKFNQEKLNIENVIFLQDDLQYVGPEGHLSNIVNEISKNNCILTGFTGVRRSTITSTYSGIRHNNVWLIKDNHFYTTGCYKHFVFDEIGKYEESYPLNKDFWGRGEDDYHQRVMNKYKNSNWIISSQMHVPIFVGVWNDPRGHYSFIRDNKRYGHYLPPPNNEKYYRNLTLEEYETLNNNINPSGFIDIAKPIGWEFAKDASGDQFKYSQSSILKEGPINNIV